MYLLSIVTFMITAEIISSTIDPGDTRQDCFQEKMCGYCRDFVSKYAFSALDGTCNNLIKKAQGAALTRLGRLLPAEYADGFDTPRGFPGTSLVYDIPTAHEVSNAVFHVATQNSNNEKRLAVIFMTFGQFLDHDLVEVPSNNDKCNKNLGGKDCSSYDVYKYPCLPIKFNRHTSKCTEFGRSPPVCDKSPKSTREIINKPSSYVDLSQVYSSDYKHNQKLRKFDGTGQLKVTSGDLMPIEHAATDSSCANPAGCSLVGDDRGDENIALNAMHTLWVRNHNFLAKRLKDTNPRWNENLIYNYARKINIGIYQHIVYNEWLPFIISLSTYSGYKINVDASITNAFSTSAFRFGHSLIPNSFEMLNNNFDHIKDPIPLQNTFGNTEVIRKDGIEPTMFGLCGNQSQEVDTTFAHGIMKRLFVKPGEGIHRDLTALNIMRGRDHGVPTYGKWRNYCGLKVLSTFEDLKDVMSDETINNLKQIYKHPNDIDLFAAGIAEKHHDGKIIGQTFQCIIKTQFERLRDGDRYFYENVFTSFQTQELKKMTLARILCDNLKGIVSVHPNSFVATSDNTRRVECSNIPQLNMRAWTRRYQMHSYY